MIRNAQACIHTYTVESFVGFMYTQQCVKVSSVNRGECVTTGGLYRPSHLCVALFELHQKVSVFFCNMIRLGGGGGCLGVCECDGPCFRR